MNYDDFLRVSSLPDLREPVILAGFAGWNDASQAATYALTSLVNVWSAAPFADLDPELFYDFSATRPTISLDITGQRSLQWPSNTFFGHRLLDSERDVVLLVGVEPQIRWRTFCNTVLHMADRIGASCLVTLGGLLADVPHTVEPRLTGFSTSARLLPQLQKLGIRLSSYEGPTGIVGALHDGWRGTSRPAISIWGNVPHYISATPNPQMSLALLRRVGALLGVQLPLSGLEAQAKAFRVQIDEALLDNPEALEYVRQLEQQIRGEQPEPAAPELIDELEEFLRSRRPPQDDSSE